MSENKDQLPQSVSVLPDGSAFAVFSMPLPNDHWLLAPAVEGWDADRDCSPDTPHPILDDSHREAVKQALRWAIRGATANGTEPDFDPDALVLNAELSRRQPAKRDDGRS